MVGNSLAPEIAKVSVQPQREGFTHEHEIAGLDPYPPVEKQAASQVPQCRNENGFTIIEILVSIVLVVVGLMAFGVLGGSIVDQNALQKRSDLALTLAQQKLEELKNSALSATLTSANNGSDNPTILNNTFTRTWTVTNGAAGSLAALAVTVTWVDKGMTKTERLKTYISQ